MSNAVTVTPPPSMAKSRSTSESTVGDMPHIGATANVYQMSPCRRVNSASVILCVVRFACTAVSSWESRLVFIVPTYDR